MKSTFLSWGVAKLGSQKNLAPLIGTSMTIVNGKRAISPKFALDLEAVLKTEAEMVG